VSPDDPSRSGDLARERAAVDLLRRRVVNVVGHELKLPVSTMRGLAEALTRATPDEVRDEIAPALIRSTARLERLVDDLLLASGIFTVLPVDPPELREVASAVERVWVQVGQGGDVAVEGDRDAHACTRGDALDRILAAVLDNAAKYGRPPVSVNIRSGDDTVVIDVTSGGTPGPDDLALVVEAFYRGEGAVTSAPGLGIGLAVASALAGQDGGRVSVRAEGDDMVASIELPVR
jgi:two-component system sensor histidine kinase KdpD